MPAGTLPDLSTEEVILNNISDQAQRDVAITAWQGKYGTASNDMAQQVTGWLRRLVNTSYSGSTFKPSGSYTGFNATNSIAIVDDLLSQLPANLEGKPLVLSVPGTAFKTLKIALRDAQAIAFNYSENSSDSFQMPGYDNITIKRDTGLQGTKVLVLTHAGNLVLGTDLMSDAQALNAGYRDNTKSKVFYKMGITLGTEIAFPENVGVYTYV
jgi:hypothetical protein